MPRRTVLIAGTGIAGTTLAHWLLKRGFDPVLVERAPHFREGGYIIDFWGLGFDVAQRMGLLSALREQGYVNDCIVFVDANGAVRSRMGGDVFRRALKDRFLSIQRGDLARTIYDTVRDEVETVFGDELVRLVQTEERVDVVFRSGRSRSFDLVVGADGLHSTMRAAIFEPGAPFERYLGAYAAAFVTRGYARRDERTYLSYGAPGRQISRFALRDDATGFLFVVRKDGHDPALARDPSRQKRALVEAFADEAWIEWPEIRRHLEDASELYFDAVSQIEIPRWSQGRVVLVGDAAWCPSLLAGEGSSFAMAGAYILAGALERFAGDHAAAFAHYEHTFRPFMTEKQKSARQFVASFVPATRVGLALRDAVLKLTAIPFIADLLMRRFVSDRFVLPDY